ncbi:MAG: hypothetical protein VX460_14790 [Planctomycetota bacterium]|nr:hypothetical protein [Planctomycetota bacterium]
MQDPTEETQRAPGALSRFATPALAASLPLALAFLVGAEAPEQLGGASFPAVARTAAAVAAVCAFAAEAMTRRDRWRRRWVVALASAMFAVGVGRLTTRSVSGEGQEDVAARLAPTELARAPDILLVFAEGAWIDDNHHEPWEVGYFASSRRRSTDLAALLTGVDVFTHGVVEDRDEPRVPTVLERLAGHGYEVAAFLPEDESSWVGRGGLALDGGLAGARAWVDGGGERPRLAVVTGAGLEEAQDLLDATTRRPGRGVRRLACTVVGMDRDGWHSAETWGPVDRRPSGSPAVAGSSDGMSDWLPSWGLPIPRSIESERSRREQLRSGIEQGGAVRFTCGAANEVHLLEVATTVGTLRVELTRLGEDPLMDWEWGGRLEEHFVYRNRSTWLPTSRALGETDAQAAAREAAGRDAAEALLDRWYEAVVLPARARRSRAAGRGL